MDFVTHRSYRGPLKAAILDWAGTTVDFGSYAPVAAFQEVFRRRGVEITTAQARGPMGTAKKVHIRMILGMEAVAARWNAVHGTAPSDTDVDSVFLEFEPIQLECLPRFAALIPGTLEAVAEFRRRGMKIGTTTGYSSEMMDVLVPESRRQGFAPDSIVTADQVPAGRPHPWMCLKSAMDMGVYPMESIVKIGDTVPDIDEGLNACMWTIGVALTGNEMGCSLAELEALTPAERRSRLEKARERMTRSGAHYVIDGIGDCVPVLDEIDLRLARGERP